MRLCMGPCMCACARLCMRMRERVRDVRSRHARSWLDLEWHD